VYARVGMGWVFCITISGGEREELSKNKREKII
jgi:hypothetical protein